MSLLLLLLLPQLSQAKPGFPQLFKGIALFTPGGDLIYCIDPTKQNRWHLHLCAGLQELLDLPEPPHFLVPCYTATVDLWLDPRTQQVRRLAEAYPLVLRHQALLNAVFGQADLVWQSAPWQDGLCDPLVLATHRAEFPQLWEERDLIVRFEQVAKVRHSHSAASSKPQQLPASDRSWGKQQEGSQASDLLLRSPPNEQSALSPSLQSAETLGYVLRLFVAGNNAATEQILQTLHQLLEEFCRHPYSLKVIDVSKYPEQAEADQVSATPTLMKVSPQPVRRIVGELDNPARILQILDAER